MRLTRVHVNESLTSAAQQVIRGSAANHISRVLRLRAGDALTLFDGRGGEFDARIDEFRKDAVLVTVSEHRAVERESPLAITLAQGVSRGERMDWVIQKATELGVRRMAPILSERTVVRMDAKQTENKVRHWQAIAVAACEQCGRNRVPAIAAPVGLSAFLAQHTTDGIRLLLSPLGKLRVRDLQANDSGVTVLIGPEGGFAEGEQQAALAAGFTALSLGPRVLRTETAAVAALTAIQQQLGDL
jgi:16S rRNA (uracil1498-N3)-methyltransferase